MVSFPNHRHKYGGWLPSKPEILSTFIDELVKLAQGPLRDTSTQHLPAVQEFKESIQGDPVMKNLFDEIFLQVVSKLNKVSQFSPIYTIHIVPIYSQPN